MWVEVRRYGLACRRNGGCDVVSGANMLEEVRASRPKRRASPIEIAAAGCGGTTNGKSRQKA